MFFLGWFDPSFSWINTFFSLLAKFFFFFSCDVFLQWNTKLRLNYFQRREHRWGSAPPFPPYRSSALTKQEDLERSSQSRHCRLFYPQQLIALLVVPPKKEVKKNKEKRKEGNIYKLFTKGKRYHQQGKISS